MRIINEKKKLSTDINRYYFEDNYYSKEEIIGLYYYMFEVLGEVEFRSPFLTRMCKLINKNCIDTNFVGVSRTLAVKVLRKAINLGDSEVIREIVSACEFCEVSIPRSLLYNIMDSFSSNKVICNVVQNYLDSMLYKISMEHSEFLFKAYKRPEIFSESLDNYRETTFEYVSKFDGKLLKSLKAYIASPGTTISEFLDIIKEWENISEFGDLKSVEEYILQNGSSEDVKKYFELVYKNKSKISDNNVNVFIKAYSSISSLEDAYKMYSTLLATGKVTNVGMCRNILELLTKMFNMVSVDGEYEISNFSKKINDLSASYKMLLNEFEGKKEDFVRVLSEENNGNS